MEVGDKVTAVSDTAQTFTSVETVQKDNSLVLIFPIYAAPIMDHSQTNFCQKQNIEDDWISP